MIATTSVSCKNLFNYAENNPVTGKDSSGNVIESAFDIVTLTGSVVDVMVHPTDPWAWMGLAGDVVDLVPGVTGVGECIKGLKTVAKVSDKIDDAVDAVGNVAKAAEKLIPDKGFDKFKDLKKYLGSLGEGNAWHHIVEQSQINKSGFASNIINNVNNVISIPHGAGTVHAKISGFYSSIPASGITNGLTVRQWLSGQSFQQQLDFGIKMLKKYGDVIETSTRWKFIPFD